MGICLNLWLLKSGLNSQSSLEEVESGFHFVDAAVVAGHVVKGHRLTKLIVLHQFLWFFQEVQGTADVFFLKVVDCENVADLAALLAGTGELLRCCAEMNFFDFEKLLKDSDCFNIFALQEDT